jgi:hypothetical protein
LFISHLHDNKDEQTEGSHPSFNYSLCTWNFLKSQNQSTLLEQQSILTCKNILSQ